MKRARLGLTPLAVASLSFGLGGCGDDLCEDANDVCNAAETDNDIQFERDCPNHEDECLASCIVDADDCSPEALTRCRDLCDPFVGS